MGKRKEMEDLSGGEGKKHKKHKHKKHKKKKNDNELSEVIKTETHSSFSSFPLVQLAPSRSSSLSSTPKSSDSSKQISPQQHGVSPKNSKKKKKDEESDEEERWLDAIESGKLEEVDDELKKMKVKDPKLMTARQRAMLERKGDATPDPSTQHQLLSLPSGYKESVLTPEMVKKNAQKRKQLVEEKREKDQKRTVERLLGKQETKTRKPSQKKLVKKAYLKITLIKKLNQVQMLLPPGIDFPLKPQTPIEPPPKFLCGVDGCSNLKKYSCSKTGVPLCSLNCYKKNLIIYSATT